MNMTGQTPSQTVGPFFHLGMVSEDENTLVNDQTKGQRITIKGKVFDGDGEPVSDALLEIWQADGRGIFGHPADPRHNQADPSFKGFGRAPTDKHGEYRFKTIKPGPIPSGEGGEYAPHINIRVFARGLLIQVYTRLYFPDEEATAMDPILNALPDERRPTLIAAFEVRKDLPTYRFNIRLQGERETVFFDPVSPSG